MAHFKTGGQLGPFQERLGTRLYQVGREARLDQDGRGTRPISRRAGGRDDGRVCVYGVVKLDNQMVA